jgi:hypothetical protein
MHPVVAATNYFLLITCLIFSSRGLSASLPLCPWKRKLEFRNLCALLSARFCQLCLISFLDLQILITPLVSSNSSFNWMHPVVAATNQNAIYKHMRFVGNM